MITLYVLVLDVLDLKLVNYVSWQINFLSVMKCVT